VYLFRHFLLSAAPARRAQRKPGHG